MNQQHREIQIRSPQPYRAEASGLTRARVRLLPLASIILLTLLASGCASGSAQNVSAGKTPTPTQSPDTNTSMKEQLIAPGPHILTLNGTQRYFVTLPHAPGSPPTVVEAPDLSGQQLQCAIEQYKQLDGQSGQRFVYRDAKGQRVGVFKPNVRVYHRGLVRMGAIVYTADKAYKLVIAANAQLSDPAKVQTTLPFDIANLPDSQPVSIQVITVVFQTPLPNGKAQGTKLSVSMGERNLALPKDPLLPGTLPYGIPITQPHPGGSTPDDQSLFINDASRSLFAGQGFVIALPTKFLEVRQHPIQAGLAAFLFLDLYGGHYNYPLESATSKIPFGAHIGVTHGEHVDISIGDIVDAVSLDEHNILSQGFATYVSDSTTFPGIEIVQSPSLIFAA